MLYIIKLKEKKHSPVILGWVKRSDNENVQINILNRLFYELSDTEDGLKGWRMGFIFWDKHPLLMTRIQVDDPGPINPLGLNASFIYLKSK